jgi:signal transduction histidine kinase/CheY-like chemotaxis protein/HPt (histidine-containing phosphotransfer) domain-containing protein
METMLTRSAIERLFTMTVTFDEQMTIVDSSQGLQTYYPAAVPGADFLALFDIHRPRHIASFKDIAAQSKSLYLLVAKDKSFAFRGQIYIPPNAGADCAVFLGSPWLSWITNNRPALQLQLADFPPHDSQTDYQYYMITQRAMVADLDERNAVVRAARDEAQQASRIQSDFFAVMSHEMRTPLNGVISALSLIEDSHQRAEREELRHVAHTSAHNLLSVINCVLDYSKLEAGKLQVETEDFDVHETINSVAEILQVKAAAKSLALNISIDPSCPARAVGDGSKIRQVLLNLVSNAVKFTDQGSVNIRAGVMTSTTDSMQLILEVQDTGIGIADDQHEHIFDAFWTSKERTAGGETNTGLGLNICRRMADLLGGDLSYQSTPGYGTCFSFSINVARSTAPVKEKEAGQSTASFPENLSGKVLLVDDNQTNLLVGQMILERMGLVVRTASDGVEAAKLQNLMNFDLILMDITMPEMDGEAATRLIRSRGDLTPIIALTAHIGEGLAQNYLNAGMQDVVHKPIERPQLSRVLAKWLPAQVPNEVPAEPEILSAPDDWIDMAVTDKLVKNIGTRNFQRALLLLTKETATRLTRLLAAWETGDMEVLTREAHAIRSSVSSFGALKLGKKMKTVELAGRDKDRALLASMMPSLAPDCEQSMAALESLPEQSETDASAR